MKKQGRIHGHPVADDWAGAVMRKPLGIQKCDGPTDGPTDTARCGVAYPRLKKQGSRGHYIVADGWAGAVMRKPLEIQNCDGRTYRPTDRHGKV